MDEYLNQFCRQETDPPLSAQAIGVHHRIGSSGLPEDTDPSQLPMELQEEYILGDHQYQNFSMEQHQHQINGQATHLSSQLPVSMNQAIDEPHYCQSYHQSNHLSVVLMETQQQGNEEEDNVSLMTTNQTTKPPQLTREQQQPCEQAATTRNELTQEMDPEIASLLFGQNITVEEATLMATLGNL
ncbi:PREDICTED: uncharacterized protein LOC104709819 [Camelina sativa]|uniref:Uncharacterized protein LOC104709819 n=1 Tax=Camelina sativa TaxID=90675 RepID=A0ABM0TDD7_CAMSA|nr:PREDICTED: uncharacterized protein LOC104709819 [Camelina sativa]